jgi:hypothetical protein
MWSICAANTAFRFRGCNLGSTRGVPISAQLISTYVSELHQRGALELAEMNPIMQAAYETARERIKEHFRHREAEAARSEVEQWKAEEIYPYKEDPKTSVEEAERKVFDIVALNVNRHLADFSEASRQTEARLGSEPRSVIAKLVQSPSSPAAPVKAALQTVDGGAKFLWSIKRKRRARYQIDAPLAPMHQRGDSCRRISSC